MDKNIYDLRLVRSDESIFLKEINSKNDISKEDKCDGYLVNCNGDEKESRRIVESLRNKGKIIAIMGYDNVYNRRILETFVINYLVSPEKYEKNDNLKQKDSGINHVLAKIAKQKNISIVIDFSDLKECNPLELSTRLSRIIQNIKICRKTNTKINIATFAKNKKEFVKKKDLQEFMLSIGASTKQAKESVEY